MKTVSKVDEIQKLKEEAAIFDKLTHPNVVQFFGLYEVFKYPLQAQQKT